MKKLVIPLVAVVAFAGGAVATIANVASAAEATSTSGTTAADHKGAPGVLGTVVSVSGNTITLTGKDGKTYSVDASSATIDKTETISVGSVAAGDTLMVGGTVSGTSVTASHIMDGKLPEGGFGGLRGGMGGKAPGVFGTVSAISGNTLTIAGKDGTTYSVDATSAKVMKAAAGAKPTATAVSNIAVGDAVSIRGTVSGSSVTATDIMDGFPMRGSKGAAK